LSAQCEPVHQEQQLAGLATTPEQGEYCGSTTPVLRQKKFESTGLEKNYRIYIDISSLLQDSAYFKDSAY